MSKGLNYIINSSASSHFTGALATGSAETETFPRLRGDGNGCLTTVQVRSIENLTWQVEVYDNDDYIIHQVTLTDVDATAYTVDGVTWYFYSASIDWNVPLTVPKETVTVGLRNRSIQSKTAGAEGAVVVTFALVK